MDAPAPRTGTLAVRAGAPVPRTGTLAVRAGAPVPACGGPQPATAVRTASMTRSTSASVSPGNIGSEISRR